MPTPPTITLYLARLQDRLAESEFTQRMTLLPSEMQEKIRRFYFWEDQHRALYGKLLLLEGLSQWGMGPQILNELAYTEFGRPFFPEGPQFNISHSGGWVVCAVNEHLRMGVDVEAIRELDLSVFKRVMTPGQWKTIHTSPVPHRTFFRYWALKESVIKANGKGLSIPLDQLEVEDHQVRHEGETWHLSEFFTDVDHAACLATEVPAVNLLKKVVNL